MPEVTLDVAGRGYRVGCGAGEEQHLRELAALIDVEARKLDRSGQMAEGRLMLMSALMIADRLHDALNRVARLEEAAAAAGDGEDRSEREAALADRLSELAQRAEKVAAEAS